MVVHLGSRSSCDTTVSTPPPLLRITFVPPSPRRFASPRRPVYSVVCGGPLSLRTRDGGSADIDALHGAITVLPLTSPLTNRLFLCTPHSSAPHADGDARCDGACALLSWLRTAGYFLYVLSVFWATQPWLLDRPCRFVPIAGLLGVTPAAQLSSGTAGVVPTAPLPPPVSPAPALHDSSQAEPLTRPAAATTAWPRTRRLPRWAPTLSVVAEGVESTADSPLTAAPAKRLAAAELRWHVVPGSPQAPALALGPCALADDNPFAPLSSMGVDEPEVVEATDLSDVAEGACRCCPSSPPRSRAKGPRAPKFIRDSLQPVSARRASRSARVITAHARFLQLVFRRTRRLAELRSQRTTDAPASAWSRGAMRGLLPILRPVGHYACLRGAALAPEEAFEAQRRRAGLVLTWYRQYSDLYRRLSKKPPGLVDLFCGGGGCSEGARRAGFVVRGIDAQAQPDYEKHFGADAFVMGDALRPPEVRRACGQVSAIGVGASPPCKAYATTVMPGQEPSAPPLLSQTFDLLCATGLMWWIENVLGAEAGTVDAPVCTLRGSHFGLHVDRPRRFWSSFGVHLDAVLEDGGRELRRGACLGGRRRFLRLDPLGRPDRTVCCRGNLYAVQGNAPTRSSVEENAWAMGVDAGHMSWATLAQSVPPPMAQLVAAQMAMHACHREFGAPLITYDEMVKAPSRARRLMARWFRGAGDDDQDAGLELEAALDASQSASTDTAGDARGETAAIEPLDERWQPPPPADVGARGARSEPPHRTAHWSNAVWGLPEAVWREAYYSHAGDFTQSVLEPDAPWWLASMHLRSPAEPHEMSSSRLVGESTFIHCSEEHALQLLPAVEAALAEDPRGTRITWVLPQRLLDRRLDQRWAARLHEAGFGVLLSCGEGEAVRAGRDGLDTLLLAEAAVVVTAGRARSCPGGERLDHAQVAEHMDPRDQGIGVEPSELKIQRSYEYIPHEPHRWRGRGFSPFVEQLMTEGHRIPGDEPTGFLEVSQYAWKSSEAQRIGGLEADRHVLAGAMEYLTPGQAREALRSGTVHPWTVVQQKDKWRACHDFSVGTNREADSAPFRLPSVHDVKPLVKPTSHFAKYDLRDGFFHVPVHPSSRNRMLIRHPVSGRLMRCSRLPFGYVASPQCFCAVTEEVAQEFRARVGRAGLTGIHLLAYVDDFLLVADTEALTRAGSRILEALFAELGLQWAPHKRRGPAQAMEFLGLLINNSPVGPRSIGLTASRQRNLRTMLDDWRARAPPAGSSQPVVVDDPRELARLLGHLVFASQVVPGGRVYLQCMLSSFSGLVVDWRRGAVKAGPGPWRKLSLDDGFWRDLDWWDDHLESNNCIPLDEIPASAAVQAGTDASDWGAGEIIYLNGAKEETRLVFTSAEKRRPINWRELLGVLRVVQVWGHRLRGTRLLVETDNMATWSTASRGRSKARDMQELLRRLFELCSRHGIRLTLTHTPGAVLDRPDQVSRGSAMEEPRARLKSGFFEALEAAFGPFSEYLGAEREHRIRAPSGESAGLFCHPTHSTVGTTLRMVGDRMLNRDGGRLRGLIVLPNAPDAQWWKLTRHMAAVSHLPAGQSVSHLESNTLGRWLPLRAERPTLIAAFPRSAGHGGYPLIESLRRADGGAVEGYVSMRADGGQRLVHPLPPGAFVFSQPDEPGEVGALYLLERGFDPASYHGTGLMRAEAARIVLDMRPRINRSDMSALPCLLDATASYRQKRKPHFIEASKLFIATPFVREVNVPVSKAKGWARVLRAFYFDFTSCEAAVERRAEGAPWPDEFDEDDEVVDSLARGLREMGNDWVTVSTPSAPGSVSSASMLSVEAPEVSPPVAPGEPGSSEWGGRLPVVPAHLQSPPVECEHLWYIIGQCTVLQLDGDACGGEVVKCQKARCGMYKCRKCGNSGRHAVWPATGLEQSQSVASSSIEMSAMASALIEIEEPVASRVPPLVEDARAASDDDGEIPIAQQPGVSMAGVSKRTRAAYDVPPAAGIDDVEDPPPMGPGSAAGHPAVAARGGPLVPAARCQLAGCNQPCYVESGGRVHDYCGASHAIRAGACDSGAATTPYSELPSNAPPGPAVARCRLAGCDRPRYVDANGYVHGFCGVSHAIRSDSGAATEPYTGTCPPCGPGAITASSAARAAVRSAGHRVPNGMGTLQLIRSDGVTCMGCSRPVAAGSRGEVFLTGFIHPLDACRRLAESTRARGGGSGAVFAAADEGGAQGSATAGSHNKQVQMQERFSAQRMRGLRLCVDGQCHLRQGQQAAARHETELACLGGCGRTLHAYACAQIPKGTALLGKFLCHHCRLAAMGAEGEPLEAVLDNATATMLLEMTTGRTRTAVGYARFARLSEVYVESMKAQGLTKILAPQDSKESFKSWMTWMVIDEGRAREFTTAIRQAAGYLKGTGRPAYTNDPDIKLMIKELEDTHGTAEQPMTIGTMRMLAASIHHVIPREFGKNPFIASRETINLINESIGCLRVSESCSGVDGYGLLANNTCILTDQSTGEVSVELKLQDSKTGLERWINMAGETLRSKIKIAEAYRNHWRLNGLHVTPPRLEGGFHVEQPDSWSVKLSLLAAPPDYEKRLAAVLALLSKEAVEYRAVAPRLLQYARERHDARGGGEEHKYVLLTEGRHADPFHREVMLLLERSQLGKIDQNIHLVAAPLLRSTHRAGKTLTPMPFMATSTYPNLKRIFEGSYLMANPPDDPDPEFDLQGHASPRLGNHSWRRYGDKIARDYKNFHQLTPTDIDLYAGWNLAAISMDMQTKYAGQQRSERVRRRKLTQMG